MFFKQKTSVLFRDYDSFGFITDNRNFGYKQIDKKDEFIGDKILSESGAIFMSVLGRKAQTIDELAEKIQKKISDVDIETIVIDAIEFYCMLEQEGFIVSGKSVNACEDKDKSFSYKLLESEINNNSLSPTKLVIENSTQEFFDDFFDGKPQLTNLHIEITSICNERCLHCYIPHENKVSYIDSDLFFNVLDQCKNMRLLHLTISGGEPMLHKSFCDFLKKCNEYNFSVNVLSNLTLLDNEKIKEMKANPLLGVQVSLYSMDSHVHDEITQMKGSFEKTKNAILKLIENDIPLQISCPIMKQNKNCYGEVIKWAENQKIHVGDDYGIIARYNHTTQNLSCRLSINEIKEVINEKVANDAKYLEQIEIAVEKKMNVSSTDFVCSVCHSSVCIADNGNVYPCAGWQDYVVGNINETSLNDIWNNSEKVQYLRGLRNLDFPECVQCSDKDYCTMCMVRNANENALGDPLIVNEFFCHVVKLNRQLVHERKMSK